jgi:DNA polymerase-3 subunit epsilon
MRDTGLSLESWLQRIRQPIDPRGSSREGNPEGALAGETVVFTGALSLPRREAADLAAQAGCNVRNAVSKKTTIVVVGQQDLRKLQGHDRSSKHRKAEDLIFNGAPIRIVGEHDFQRLVDLGQEST